MVPASSASCPVANSDAYSAARGAQNAYVQAVGADVARHNVQVNAIAQAYVESVDAFQRDTWETEPMRQVMRAGGSP